MFCVAGVAACQEEERAQGPDDVLKQFVVEMRQVHGDPEAGERAVALMWEPARENLAERARRASALSGRELAPAELVVPSWFALHRGLDQMHVRLDGDWAEVTVEGGEQEPVKARCKRESDGWKVALELPPLAPIRQREEAR